MEQEDVKQEPGTLQILTGEAIEALNRAEIDIQIATAKKWPRSIKTFKEEVLTMATLDAETAAGCFYIVRRGGKSIEGPSARLAEIVAAAYTNIRVQTRIIANDGRTITAQGGCMDLEKNYGKTTEVKRSIRDKQGRMYSEDMQVMTGNAAASIASRNAVFQVIPFALIKSCFAEIKEVALGKGLSMEQRRTNCLEYFKKKNVSEKRVFDAMGVKGKDDLDKGHLIELIGIKNAIEDGDTTIAESFPVKKKEEKIDEQTSNLTDQVTKATTKAKK